MLYGPKCKFGHPLQHVGERCSACEQIEKEQAIADSKLLEALRRLHARGDLLPLLEEVLTLHD